MVYVKRKKVEQPSWDSFVEVTLRNIPDQESWKRIVTDHALWLGWIKIGQKYLSTDSRWVRSWIFNLVNDLSVAKWRSSLLHAARSAEVFVFITLWSSWQIAIWYLHKHGGFSLDGWTRHLIIAGGSGWLLSTEWVKVLFNWICFTPRLYQLCDFQCCLTAIWQLIVIILMIAMPKEVNGNKKWNWWTTSRQGCQIWQNCHLVCE